MSIFKKNDENFTITIPNNENINISLVYNRAFFGLFDFDDYHVNSFGKDVQIVSDQLSYKERIDLDESDDDLRIATEILGREKLPDGYSQLPLQFGGSILDSLENSLTSAYDKYSKFFTTSPKTETFAEELVDPSIQNKEVRVTFPKRHFEVTPLSALITASNTPSIFKFSSHFDYHEIEQLAKDLIYQLKYFENEGVGFQDITVDSIFKIQDRYLIIDSQKLVMFKGRSEHSSMHKSVYNLIITLMGQTRNDSLYIVPYTKLYYMLHRLELEDVFEWV
jgi:hypothetical protein